MQAKNPICSTYIREEEEAEKFLGKIEDVNSMLGQLMSKDDKEVDAGFVHFSLLSVGC